MLLENLMFGNVSAIQSSFWISGSDASLGPVKVSLMQECDAPMKPSNSVANVLLRFRSTPHAVRAAGSIAVLGTPVSNCARGDQKSAANGSSVSRPPTTQWLVRFRRWLL